MRALTLTFAQYSPDLFQGDKPSQIGEAQRSQKACHSQPQTDRNFPRCEFVQQHEITPVPQPLRQHDGLCIRDMRHHVVVAGGRGDGDLSGNHGWIL